MLSQNVITFCIHYIGLLGVKCWLESLQAQIACLISITERDEINVHVVAVQSQVIGNNKTNFIHICYWLIIDKAPNTGREYKIRDF